MRVILIFSSYSWRLSIFPKMSDSKNLQKMFAKRLKTASKLVWKRLKVSEVYKLLPHKYLPENQSAGAEEPHLNVPLTDTSLL